MTEPSSSWEPARLRSWSPQYHLLAQPVVRAKDIQTFASAAMLVKNSREAESLAATEAAIHS
jgi:hypothetical protein